MAKKWTVTSTTTPRWSPSFSSTSDKFGPVKPTPFLKGLKPCAKCKSKDLQAYHLLKSSRGRRASYSIECKCSARVFGEKSLISAMKLWDRTQERITRDIIENKVW